MFFHTPQHFTNMFFLLFLSTWFFNGVAALHPSHSPKVYIYEDKAVDWSYLLDCYKQKHGIAAWRDEEGEHAQNMAEVWVHQTLLKHQHRTWDPIEADMFYIPLYISVSSDVEPMAGSLMCEGLTHMERMKKALDFLGKESKYFKNLGGSDHFFVCAWWRCGVAMGNRARVLLSRSVIGINESPPVNNIWARWECLNKVVTVPYVSSTKIHGTKEWKYSNERHIPFYFAGRARGRKERENMAVIGDVYPTSLIGVSEWDWAENPDDYGDHISSSQFCLMPRGDTNSSRRLFDSISSGCVPVITNHQLGEGNVPFHNHLNYSEFSAIVPDDSFSTEEKVKLFAEELYNMDTELIDKKREHLAEARRSLIYGYSYGDSVEDMEIIKGPVNKFLKEVYHRVNSFNKWYCDPIAWWEHTASYLDVSIPPPIGQEADWALGTETIVIREHNILMCTPPFTGSRPVRDFLRKVQEGSSWEVKNYRGGFDIIRLDGPELFEIYSKVGWIKSSMVRDPVVRALSAYLKRNPGGDPENFKLFMMNMYYMDPNEIEYDFRPMVSFCGMKYSHFENIIPLENVYENGRKLMESLPNDLWKKYGKNWLQSGTDVFEHSYGEYSNMNTKEKTIFDECEWAKYYDNHSIWQVEQIYKEDYDHFRWYNTEEWYKKMDECTGGMGESGIGVY